MINHKHVWSLLGSPHSVSLNLQKWRINGAATQSVSILGSSNWQWRRFKVTFLFWLHFASKYLTFCSVFERYLVVFFFFYLYSLVYEYIWVFWLKGTKPRLWGAALIWVYRLFSRQSLLELKPQAVVRKKKKKKNLDKLLQWVIRTVCVFNNSRLCTPTGIGAMLTITAATLAFAFMIDFSVLATHRSQRR